MVAVASGLIRTCSTGGRNCSRPRSFLSGSLIDSPLCGSLEIVAEVYRSEISRTYDYNCSKNFVDYLKYESRTK